MDGPCTVATIKPKCTVQNCRNFQTRRKIRSIFWSRSRFSFWFNSKTLRQTKTPEFWSRSFWECQTPASGNGTGFQGQTVVLGFSDVEFRFWRIQRSRSHPQRSFCLLTWFHGFWGKLRVCLPTRVLRIRINHRQFLKATAVSFQTPILPTPSDHPCAC